MSSSNFDSVWLGAKTYFSLGESIISPKQLIAHAKRSNISAVFFSDTNTLSAFPELLDLGIKNDILIVPGVSFTVVENINWRKPKRGEKKSQDVFWRPSVYAKTEKGLKLIMKMLSIANDEDHYYFQPRLENKEFVDLLENSYEDVFVTTGNFYPIWNFRSSRFANVFAQFCASKAVHLVAEILCFQGKNYFFDTCNKIAFEFAKKQKLSIFSSRPSLLAVQRNNVNVIHSGIKLEAELLARNTMNAIVKNHKFNDPWRVEPSKNYILPYGGVNITNLCDFLPDETQINLTREPSLPQIGDINMLKAKVAEGWKLRIENEVLGYKPDMKDLAVFRAYKDRVKYELSVLEKMHFENYFLLVEYITSWCKEQGIIVGPGRGSVGGSLVAFLLGITDVDPIRFGLIFERFINPERLDLPDIDLDFMSSRREEVISHLKEKFGEDHVAGISNYSYLGAASAIRSVGSVFRLTEDEISASKTIPKVHGQPMSLRESLVHSGPLQKFKDENPQIFEICERLEGVVRNFSQHAAGVVVSGEPIENMAVLENRGGSKVINWDKRNVERFGLVKLDVLGLQTLDVLSLCKTMVEENKYVDVVYEQIPLNDSKVLEKFEKGETVAVFQFESSGMRQILQRLSLTEKLSFEDIAAVTALYRPGPLEAGLVEDYISIRQGAKSESYYPKTENALKETHSVIVYQEQVMQIARDLCGFSMSEADLLRKAMGKKDASLMATQKQKFVEGAVNKGGMDEITADHLFTLIEEFAGYAFNKSHSIEYTIISYWCMYMKTYYPEEFYAAALSILPEEKLFDIVTEAESFGLQIFPPDINISSTNYIARDGKLYAPFQSIKGFSLNRAQAVLDARDKVGGTFKSVEEFEEAVDKRKCNVSLRKTLEEIGSYCSIDSTVGPHDVSRLKAQKVFLPGIISTPLKVERAMVYHVQKENERFHCIRDCKKCEFSGVQHTFPKLFAGKKKEPKVMVVLDYPVNGNASFDVLSSDWANTWDRLVGQVGLNYFEDFHFTSLMRVQKVSGEKFSQEAISACSEHLDREIEEINPQLILAMGGASIRYFDPSVRGSWSDLCGREIYDAKNDRTIIFGMNPNMIHFDKTKFSILENLVKKVARYLK